MDHSLAGEWVHQKIDAAAQSELLPVEAARAQPNDESRMTSFANPAPLLPRLPRARVVLSASMRPARCWIKPARKWSNEISSMSNGNWEMSTGCYSLRWRGFAAPMGAWFCAIARLPQIQLQNGRLAGLATKDFWVT
jgi:hypothetical protein